MQAVLRARQRGVSILGLIVVLIVVIVIALMWWNLATRGGLHAV